jgi:hypothetical protein
MVGRPLLVAARLPVPLRVLLAVLLVGPLLASCSGSDDATPRPTPSPTPIGKLDAGSVRLVRAEFCDRLPAATVEAALGGKPTGKQSWGNGDPVPNAAGDSGDVGHELGCAWTGATGATARAWVFARPVTTAFATSVAGQAVGEQGCTAAQTPGFGSPSVLQTCTLPGNTQRVRRAGLFGDTWLTCELSGAAADLEKRTDRWCAAVVSAAAR